MGDAPPAAASTAQLSQLVVTVSSAKLSTSGGLFSSKPDPYLELSVDGQPPRKTNVCRKTLSPKWDDHFTVLVTPYSKLDLKVLSCNSIRTDTIIGHTVVELYPLLEKENGKLKAMAITVDLKAEGKNTAGELSLSLDGLEINMKQFPKKVKNGPRPGGVANGSAAASSPTELSPSENAQSAQPQTGRQGENVRRPAPRAPGAPNSQGRTPPPVPPPPSNSITTNNAVTTTPIPGAPSTPASKPIDATTDPSSAAAAPTTTAPAAAPAGALEPLPPGMQPRGQDVVLRLLQVAQNVVQN